MGYKMLLLPTQCSYHREFTRIGSYNLYYTPSPPLLLLDGPQLKKKNILNFPNNQKDHFINNRFLSLFHGFLKKIAKSFLRK
jgi:hypothetical protein